MGRVLSVAVVRVLINIYTWLPLIRRYFDPAVMK